MTALTDNLRFLATKKDGDPNISRVSSSTLVDAADEIERLRHPFRNADGLDWEHLFRMLPDSGHGKFWKAVLTEARAALADR